MTNSRARQTLDIVLSRLDDPHRSIEVQNSWVESDNVFCLIFTSRWVPARLSPRGLRRTVDEHWTVEQVADYVLTSELGEPLGALNDELTLHDGVWWFTGDRPEWREPLGPGA